MCKKEEDRSFFVLFFVCHFIIIFSKIALETAYCKKTIAFFYIGHKNYFFCGDISVLESPIKFIFHILRGLFYVGTTRTWYRAFNLKDGEVRNIKKWSDQTNENQPLLLQHFSFC